MGKKSLMMIMVALMAFFMIVMPVSANVVGTKINQGATVFIGEEGLNITPVFTSNSDYIVDVSGLITENPATEPHPVDISGTLSGTGFNAILDGELGEYDATSHIATVTGHITGTITGDIIGTHMYNPESLPDVFIADITGTKNGQPFTGTVTGHFAGHATGMLEARITGEVTSVTNTRIGWWASGADLEKTSPRTIDVNSRLNSMSITPSEFSGYTGNWYIVDNLHAGNLAFYVMDPILDLDVRSAINSQSVTGGTVVRGIPLTFRINTNLVLDSNTRRNADGSMLNPTEDGYITIKVKSENGATYSKLYNESGEANSITNLYVTHQPYTWEYHWATGNIGYPAGTYVISAESNLNGMKDNYRQGGADYTGKTVSSAYTITLSSESLKLEINKESVVRGNGFSVTLVGQPLTNYTFGLKGTTALETGSGEKPPMMVRYQEGVTPIDGSLYHATVRTDTSGLRTIGFTTNTNTQEHKFTIRANSSDLDKYDEVYINVVEGELTLTAQGDQTYYLGEEIKFTGTNSETSNVYFFIIGPNLNSNGANINYPSVTVVTGNASTFRSVEVESDDTFKYDWSTAMVDLDAGTYTIYAVSMPNAKSDLSDVAYATTSIVIKKPYVSAKVPKNIIAKGDAIKIVGEASGDPSSVKIWILGKNFVKSVDQSVDSDDTYEYEIPAGETTGMASGQYFIVVQHPMQNGVFDIYRDGNYVYNAELGGDEKNMQIFTLEGGGSLQGSDAAQALVEAINDPNIDDTYTKLNFMLSEAVIAIDPIPDKHIGDKFTLTGKTNLAVDDEILIEVYSSSFGPTQKTKSGEFSGTTGSVKVVKGTSNDGYNIFSLDIDATSFKADEYLVMAEGIIQDATGTALFNVLDYVPTPVPTVATPIPTVIEPVTVPPTVPPTIEPTAVPTTTKSPGFGAVLACIGLMGVGFVVMRRS